jgi:hypothetical protein
MNRSAFSLIPDALRAPLMLNARTSDADPVPLLKLFNPVGPGRWLITELMPDEETMFGLCEPGRGAPELDYVSLYDLAEIRLPFGLSIARDRGFSTVFPVSVWRSAARRTGSISAAEALLHVIARRQAGAP